MSRHYTGMGRYEHLFDQLDAAISRLESRCDKIERRVTNLPASKATYAQQACYDSRRGIRIRPLPEPPPHPTPAPSYAQTRRSYLPYSQPPCRTQPYTSGPSLYISQDMYGPQPYWDPPNVLRDTYQPRHERSNSSRYSTRQNAHQPPRNASTSGDQFVEQERPLRQPHCVRKAQQQFLPAKKQSCWDLPAPRRQPTCWNLPEKRIQQRASAYEPPAPTGWPPRPQPSPVRQPTCWDPPEQQGYPTPVEPLDRACARFQPLPQPPQPHRYRREVDEDRCYGEVVTHTHSPALNGDEELCDSDGSILEEEHCENLGNMLLMDSKSETEVEEVCGADASNSDATGVSISSIALLDEKHGVEEDRAVSPAGHQVSASKEIYWSCSSNVNNILSTAPPLPAAALLSDVDGDFKCLLQGLLQLDLHVPEAEVCKWRRSPLDDHISPPLLIFYGGKEGRRSAVRCVFDPGGDASPKFLLSTLFVASWFPP